MSLQCNCSSDALFKVQAIDLRTRFREKGYPENILGLAYKKALATKRPTLLTPKSKSREDGVIEPIRLIGTYDEAAASVRTILQKH